MRVALVHDWLTGMRGGERCLLAFLRLFPNADVYTLFHVPGATHPIIDDAVKGASILQRLPGAGRHYRLLLPLYPVAVRGFDFSGYDLVISLSHAAVKNIRVPSGIPHLCYLFTPMRYIWDQAFTYFGPGALPLWPLISGLRSWDRRGSQRVTSFAVISEFIASRVRRYYGLSSQVIYPPVDTEWIEPGVPGRPGEAFLYAGALVRYKRVDLIVEAFNRCGQKLWVVGRGPMEASLRRMAGRNIEFLGHVPDERLAELYRRCRALIFAGREDFGLVPIECMAAGRPVIASWEGGVRETVRGVSIGRSGVAEAEATGVFIPKSPGPDDLVRGLRFFMEREEHFTSYACRRQAMRFAPEVFFNSWRGFLKQFNLQIEDGRSSGTQIVGAASVDSAFLGGASNE